MRSAGRDGLQRRLAAEGIDTLIHYPVPIPQQPALAAADPADCPEADRACAEVLSLPLHTGMADAAVDAVADAIAKGHDTCEH